MRPVKQHAAEALKAATEAAAEAASKEAAANPEPAPKTTGNGQVTGKSGEERELAQVKEWNDETAIPKLIPLLQDPNSLVRGGRSGQARRSSTIGRRR